MPSSTAALETTTAPGFCPECGYSLAGLPAAGRCPECGFGYDEELMVLWGWAAGSLANSMNMYFRSAAGRWACIITLGVWGIYCVLSGSSVLGVALSLGAIIDAVYSWNLLRRGFTKPPAPVQLRISPAGLGQRDGYGGVRLRPWPEGVVVELRPPDGHRARIRCILESEVGYVTSCLCNFEFETTAAEWTRIRGKIVEFAVTARGKVRTG